MRGITTLAVCALALAAVGGTSSVRAGTITVTSLNESGPGSLREAIASAAAGDMITFSVKGTITLTSGPLFITQTSTSKGRAPTGSRSAATAPAESSSLRAEV